MNCPDNPRDIAEAIDDMVDSRVQLHSVLANSPQAHAEIIRLRERIELKKRIITDYLLVNDRRKGVYYDDNSR